MRGVILISLLLLSGAAGRAARAQADEAEAGGVVLQIRTVKAEGALQRGSDPASPVVDQRLEDLRGKLAHLPYSSFRLLATRDIEVAPLKKNTIRIDNGQVLNVRLLYASAKKVGMWVRWSDKDGMELLDTRMHFHCDEAMIAGTSSGANSGVVLAVGVRRK